MARPPRFEYRGAFSQVTARGDGGNVIIVEKEDHLLFLSGLSRVCGSHGWQVHAWVLMGNQFHVLLETPEANPAWLRGHQGSVDPKPARLRDGFLN